MKTFLAFLGLISIVTAAQEPKPCTVCHQGAGSLMTLLTALNSSTSLTYQEDIIIEQGCSNWPDPNGCAVAVEAWWRRMANVVYSGNFTAFAPNCYCHWDNLLPKSTWDCDSCIADVRAFAEVGMSQETGMAIQEALQGPAFCEDEDLGLSDEEMIACKQFTDGIGGAFGLIFNYVGKQAYQICQNRYLHGSGYGVCDVVNLGLF